MPKLKKTDEFDAWFKGLKDARAKAKVAIRLDRLAAGNPGRIDPVGNSIGELKIDYGPGYRVYILPRGEELVIILGGGTKKRQSADIKEAKRLAKEITNG